MSATGNRGRLVRRSSLITAASIALGVATIIGCAPGGEPAFDEADLRELGPDVAAPAVARSDDAPARLEGVILRDEAPHGIGDELLLFAVVELHPSPRLSLAMMLRWISFDPA